MGRSTNGCLGHPFGQQRPCSLSLSIFPKLISVVVSLVAVVDVSCCVFVSVCTVGAGFECG